MTDTATDSTTDTGTGSATTDDTSTGTDTDTVDWKAEAEKQKAFARKHEDRAKANAAAAKELETLKQSSMTDQQKAVETAKAEARTEALREVGGKLAAAEIRVAAAGRNVDVNALLEGVDASKFLDDEGNPDTKAITAWIDKVAPAGDDKVAAGRRDLGLGARSGQPSGGPEQDFANFLTGQLKT